MLGVACVPEHFWEKLEPMQMLETIIVGCQITHNFLEIETFADGP